MFKELLYLPPWFWLTFFGLLGLCLGSFANVIVVRLPLKQSSIFPNSHCPSCKHSIPWKYNIPVLSWLYLRGKCARCKVKISWRYPLIEFLMGLIFSALYLKLGLSWFFVECLIFSFCLVVVSFIDFEHMILPDVFTLSGIVIGLLGAALNPERAFLDAFLGVLLGGGLLWSVAWVYYSLRKQEGMGGGDIKLLAWLGALVGLAIYSFCDLSVLSFGNFSWCVHSFCWKETDSSNFNTLWPLHCPWRFALYFCRKAIWTVVFLHVFSRRWSVIVEKF